MRIQTLGEVNLEKTQSLAGYKCPLIHYDAPGIPIIFLHGMSYTSEIWQEIGVTDALMQKNIPFVALDMPYGAKSQCYPKTRNVEKNMVVVNQIVRDTLGGAVPILVGASIGGNMALQYAVRFQVKGLLLVGAPRGLEPDLVAAYNSFKFPITLVWGSYDTIVAGEEMRTLSEKLPNSRLIIYNGAGHSAYRDQPEKFQQNILELYARAEHTP